MVINEAEGRCAIARNQMILKVVTQGVGSRNRCVAVGIVAFSLQLVVAVIAVTGRRNSGQAGTARTPIPHFVEARHVPVT